jgi:hypothetical protein
MQMMLRGDESPAQCDETKGRGLDIKLYQAHETRTPLNNCLSLYVSYNYPPLVPRWLLIVIDINLFWIVLLLDPQGF